MPMPWPRPSTNGGGATNFNDMPFSHNLNGHPHSFSPATFINNYQCQHVRGNTYHGCNFTGHPAAAKFTPTQTDRTREPTVREGEEATDSESLGLGVSVLHQRVWGFVTSIFRIVLDGFFGARRVHILPRSQNTLHQRAGSRPLLEMLDDDDIEAQSLSQDALRHD
ncbi:hypothetical protein PM082_024049 [Marasmius tenuissimus]|nr:hypothetical protein PM082_024049 [Marasmius tenuissimus]